MAFKFEDAQYLNTIEKIEAFDAFLMEGDAPKFELLAFDTETNGIEFHKSVVIGFSISVSKDTGWYLPLLEWKPDPKSFAVRSRKKVKVEMFEKGHFVDVWSGKEYPENVTPRDYSPPDFVKMFLDRWTSGSRLIMHNAVFDCCIVAYNFGLDLAPNLFCDTILLHHVIDENSLHGLKEVASQWKKELGFNPDEDAKKEQKELGESIVRNGGTFNQRTKHVWRGDPWMVAKYGASDTALTFGVFEAGMKRLEEEYTPAHFEWFFEKEVMPVCKEVVIPMTFGGVYIDVPYFEKLERETQEAMDNFEDRFIEAASTYLKRFDKGPAPEKAVTEKRFIEKLIELEGLEYPSTKNKKGEVKKTLGKKAVQSAYQANPHWLWGYILGEDEIRYSDEKLQKIRADLYREAIKRRHRFNVNSDDHLRWLFCDQLGFSRTELPQTDSATKENPIPSMAAEVLKDHFLKKHPTLVKPLLRYKKLSKFLGSYIKPALALNNNGWLHMDMKQHGTTSGRFSCSGGFNLQTLPKVEELDKCPRCDSKKIKVEYPISLLATLTCESCGHVEEDVVCPSAIKRGFIAPPGYKIINADYSSLEPRCFAFVSGDEKIKEIFRKDLDMYSKFYCDMFDEECAYSADPNAPNFLKKKNKQARDDIKPVVLGIPYGARGPQVANLMNLRTTKTFKDKETGKRKTIEVLDVEKGWEIRDLYLETYVDLANYMILREAEAMSQGYVETLIGRRRHYVYAPFVSDLLRELGVEYEDFLDVRRRDLEPETAMGGRLPKEALYAFGEMFDIPLWQLREKGGWNYVRNVFKNELNNAKNAPIQGLAGHITNKGMLDTTRFFRQNGVVGYVCLQVHDEITCYARMDQAEIAAQCLKKGMEDNEFAKRLDIPMIADPIICDNMKDSK